MRQTSLFILMFLFVSPIHRNERLQEDSQIRTKQHVIGVTGHPINQPDYLKVPIIQQLEIIKSIGFNYYRMDVNIDGEGKVRFNEARFDTLVAEASDAGIEILPMLYLYDLNYKDNVGTAWKKGFAIGNGFSKKYGKHIRYYELGNELEIPILTKRQLSGISIVDYDISKAKIVSAFLKGMNTGIKTNNPLAKTIINIGESHVGFFKLLQKFEVEYDVAGHHWYTGKLYHSSGHHEIIDQIAKLHNYKKPIWITEFNFFQGARSIGEHTHFTWTYTYLRQLFGNSLISGVFFYELLDEPNLSIDRSKSYEKNFGLLRVNQTGSYEFKNVSKAFKDTLIN